MWRRGWADAANALHRPLALVLMIAVDAAAGAVAAVWVWTTKEPTGFEVAVGGAVGALAGLVVVGVVLLGWTCARAPFRQRDEARRRLALAHLEREDQSRPLPQQLDALLREGLALLDETSQPLDEQYPDHRYPFVPDDDKVDRAVEFCARARLPLEKERPHLLPDFAIAANAVMKKERQRRKDAEPDESASAAEKLRSFTEATHAQPGILIQGALAGLAEARGKLGHQ